MGKVSVIDVDDFFEKIVEGYANFGQSAAQLAAQIPTLSPDIIQSRCRQLNREREQLSVLDEQLIEILSLGGEDLIYSSHINRYRKAFSSAVRAFDDIHDQLLTIRQQMQNTTRH